jgi:outer membrane protein TolC
MKIAFMLSFLAAGVAGGVLLTVDNPEANAQSKIKSLQKDLIASLKQVVDIAAQQRNVGRMSPLDALEAQRPFLDVTLDASDTNQERIRVLERIVELQKKIETLAEIGHKNARNSFIDALNAKAARIKAEIALEKEKSNGVK